MHSSTLLITLLIVTAAVLTPFLRQWAKERKQARYKRLINSASKALRDKTKDWSGHHGTSKEGEDGIGTLILTCETHSVTLASRADEYDIYVIVRTDGKAESCQMTLDARRKLIKPSGFDWSTKYDAEGLWRAVIDMRLRN